MTGGAALVNAGKQTCVRGHAFDLANTRAVDYGNGARRVCRICERELRRRQRADPVYAVREKRRRWARDNAA